MGRVPKRSPSRPHRKDKMRRIDEIILHCSGSEFGNAQLIDVWHREKGFKSIGYHFVVLNPYLTAEDYRLGRPKFQYDGVVQDGRPLEQVGAHCEGHNDNSVGICLIGKRIFTSAQFVALVNLLAKLHRRFPSLRLLGHYEAQSPTSSKKSCPNLDMDFIRTLVNFK